MPDFAVGVKVGPVSGATEGANAVKPLTDAVGQLEQRTSSAAKAAENYAQSQARQAAVAASVLAGLQAEARAMAENFQAAQRGAQAMAELQAKREGELLLLQAGVTAESEMGRAILATLETRRQLTVQTEEAIAAQREVNAVEANVAGLQERTAAMRQELALLQLTGEAQRAYAAALEEAKAIAASGATPGTAVAGSVAAEVAEQQRLRGELQAVASARELDAQAAEKEAAAQEQLASVLSSLKAAASQTSELAAAERGGAQAVALLNRQLEVRNALLKAGVAEINAEGRLVITNQAGATAVREQVAALQAEKVALEEVQAASARATAPGAWGVLSGAIDQVLQGLKWIVIYGGLIGIAGKIKEAIEEAFRFEASLTRLRTLVGTTAEEVEKIRAAIVGVSLATGQTADENAKAMFAIESSGLRGEQALRALEASAQGAAIGLGDQTTVARAAVSAMVAYGAENLSAKDALDVLIATAREGNTTVEDLAGSFGRVTGIAASVGVKFGDLGAAVASFTRVGVSAAEAVTGLRGILSALELKDAKGADAALRTVGLSMQALKETIANKGLAAALVDLVSRFDGNNEALAKVVPNIRALAELLSNAKSQAGSYLEIQDKVNASIGHATDEAFALLQHDPSFVWKQAKAALEEVGRSIGEQVLPKLVELAKDVREAVTAGALDGWAKGVAVAFDALVVSGRALAFVFSQWPVLLGVLVFALGTSTAAATAFGNAVIWLRLQLIDLEAVIVANPYAAAAVAILVVVAAMNAWAQAQAKVDQAFLNETARINEDEIALAKLGDQYVRVNALRNGQAGPPVPVQGNAAIIGSRFGHIELSQEANSFLGQLKAINDAYDAAIKAAGGDKEETDRAKLAHDRDTQALQAHTQAYIDDTRAAVARMEILEKSATSDLATAYKTQAAAREALQHAGLEQLGAGGGPPVKTLAEAARAADAEVQRLSATATKYRNEVATSKEVLDALQKALDRSRVAHENLRGETDKGTRSAENFHLTLKNSLALRAQEIADAKAMAAAQLVGGEAVQQATVAAQANKLVVEAQGKAAKDHTVLRKDEEAAIRSSVAALAQANQQVALSTQLAQSRNQTMKDQIAGWAKLQDAVSQTTTATARNAAVQAVYDAAEQKGIPLNNEMVRSLAAEARARVDLAQQIANSVKDIDAERDHKLALADAEAAYEDAVTGGTDSMREATFQRMLLAAVRGKTPQEAKVEEDILRIWQQEILSLKEQAARTLELREARKASAEEVARFADLAAERASNAKLGTEITSILRQYGLLDQAVTELAIKERARQLFLSEGNIRTLAEITAELKAREAESRALRQAAADVEIHKVKTAELYTALVTVFDLLSTGFGGASTAAGRLAADMGKLVAAIQAVTAAQGAANKAMAAAGAISAVGGILAGLNVGGAGKTGGPQALGGQLDSNYGGVGSLVGSIIGAIIGHGSPAGLALGAAIGGAIGAMISKAGDSASATLLAGGNVQVNESSRALNGAVKDALLKIFQGLQAAMASLGLVLQGLPFIDIKVRDNIVRVIVGEVVRTFSSMQDAISFGIAEALKQTAAAGGGHLPPEVMQALARTTATDLQSLQSDIDFALSIANYGVPQVVQAIDKAISDFYVAMQRAVSLGIDTTNVIARFSDQIQAQKDAILQVNRGLSPEEQMRRDAAAFNQRMLLLKAQEEADIADLMFKRADLEAKIAIARAEMGVRKAADAAALESLAIMGAALGQLDTAIASAQAVLASIVTISDQELADALARLRSGGGRGGGRGAANDTAIKALQDLIDNAKWAAFTAGMTDVQKQIAEIDKKYREAEAAVHLNANALEDARKAHEAALRAAHGNADAIRKANEAYANATRRIRENQAALDAANAARQQEIDLLKTGLDARYAAFTAKGLPGESIAASIKAIDDTARDLTTDARALAEAGALSAAELAAMVAGIDAATAAQRAAVKQSVLDSVDGFLGAKGATGLLGTLRGLTATASTLTGNLQALAAAGLLSAQDLALLTQRILEGTKAQQDAAITSASDALLGELYGLLGMDKEAAQLKYDLAVAELEAKRAELAAAMTIAKYTEDQMRAVLDPIDKLIQAVITAGPSLFENNSGGSSSGSSVPWVSPTGALSPPEAYDLLAQYQKAAATGALTINQELEKVTYDFDRIRAVFGYSAVVQEAYAQAIQNILNKYINPIVTYLTGLNLSSASPLTGRQQFQQAQGDFLSAVAAIQGGNLTQLPNIVAMAQALLQQAQAVLPLGSEAYRQIYREVTTLLNQIVASYGGAQAGGAPIGGLPPGSSAGAPAPGASFVPTPQGGVNLDPLAHAFAQGSADQVNVLRTIATNTGGTTAAVDRLTARLDRGVGVFQSAS